MQQAIDFLAESRDVYALVEPLSDADLQAITDFKDWTVEDVIRHLHFWNTMALTSLSAPDEFAAAFAPVADTIAAGGTLRDCERASLAGIEGRALVAAWAETFAATADAYAITDPAHRCVWAGPTMSARSSISARQMETWAHAQAIYDLLGRDRIEQDRIQNIVVLGINTFNWSFQVRGQEAPGPMPNVELTAPSGATLSYGDNSSTDRIAGSAVEFARVVTQTRNIADTALSVTGPVAQAWMENAQCFAGGPNPPPLPGVRHKRG